MTHPAPRLALLTACLALHVGIAHAQQDAPDASVTDSDGAPVQDGSGAPLILEGGVAPNADAQLDPDVDPADVDVERIAEVSFRKLGERSLFAFDSSELTPDGEAELDRIIAELEQFDDVTAIGFFGHTDAIGTDAYNLDLSERRAASVAAYVAPAFPDARIEIDGLGEQDPIATNETAEGRQMNRRVEINLVVAEAQAID